MSNALIAGVSFFLGVFCTASAWRVPNRKARVGFGVVLSVFMVGMWHGMVLQIDSAPTFARIAWSLAWSSPAWLAGVLLCAWLVPVKEKGR